MRFWKRKCRHEFFTRLIPDNPPPGESIGQEIETCRKCGEVRTRMIHITA